MKKYEKYIKLQEEIQKNIGKSLRILKISDQKIIENFLIFGFGSLLVMLFSFSNH